MPSVAVKVSITTPYPPRPPPHHAHQANPYCLDPLIGVKGRSKVGLHIHITVSLLCVINHKAERGKERRKERIGRHSIQKRCRMREAETETNNVCLWDGGQERKCGKEEKKRGVSGEKKSGEERSRGKPSTTHLWSSRLASFVKFFLHGNRKRGWEEGQKWY